MNAIFFLLATSIFLLLIWNVVLFHNNKTTSNNEDKKYFDLNAKLNFITAVGSMAILVISYLGFNVKDEILKKSEKPISDMIELKLNEIDSLITSKNLLNAGIYIVNDLDYKENKIYKFKDLMTIDNKHLPDFSYAPKLIINTSTGENLRIVKVTTEYFILENPISKNRYLIEEDDNVNYPSKVKFDIWIADYKKK